MSRWESVNDSIRRQRQSDGCGRLMIILVLVVAFILVIIGVWKFGSKPRCWACNHFRHEQRMCGWSTGGLGTCICEKDR